MQLIKLWLIKVLKIENYESCENCSLIKQQLEIANNEKRELLETILNLVKPRETAVLSEAKELEPMKAKFTSFSRKRAALEESARIAARAVRESPLSAKPDLTSQETKESIAKLEEELLGEENAG